MKYHQNITINGAAQPSEYPSRKNSVFFNEGKWRTFIEPYLPRDVKDQTFIEIGSNVGLFLRMAEEYGYRRVVGLEGDPRNCAMAERYRDAHGCRYTVINGVVGHFDVDELPAADVVLLSNVHYHIHMSAFVPLIDRLRHKARRVVVVSRRLKIKKHGYPRSDVPAMRLMFRDWRAGRVIRTTREMLDGDPHPREVTAISFDSDIERQPISDHTTEDPYEKQAELIERWRLEKAGRPTPPLEKTLNWQFWAKRKPAWSDEQVRAQVQYRYEFVRDMVEHGMKQPILTDPARRGIDGGNRAAVLKLLGHESILVRIV